MEGSQNPYIYTGDKFTTYTELHTHPHKKKKRKNTHRPFKRKMAEKKSTLDLNMVPVIHASANVAPPSVNASRSGELAIRKRGRPRKSDAAAANLVVPQGSAVASPPVMTAVASMPVASLPLISAVVSPQVISAVVSPQVPQVVLETPLALTFYHSAENSANRIQGRGRGRPRGSGNLWMLTGPRDTAVGDFKVHMIDVQAGEDIILKIMSLVQNGPRGICVISANGTVSTATIRQLGSSGGVINYEGHFELVSLNGSSIVLSETGGVRCRTGGFSVSLSVTDGHVIGGLVAGPLVAATPVHIVVGSFIPNATLAGADTDNRIDP